MLLPGALAAGAKLRADQCQIARRFTAWGKMCHDT